MTDQHREEAAGRPHQRVEEAAERPSRNPSPDGAPAAPRIRIVIADDQPIVRDGIRTVLDLLPDLEVVAEAADGAEAVALVAEHRPDVALLDLRMPVLDGAGATARISAEHPETRVLILTTYDDDASIAAALRAGARGYLTKDAGREQLAAAIRSVHRGQTTLAPEIGDRLVRGLRDPEPPDLRSRFPTLTEREAEVLALVADGLANPEIARRLFVSTATVKTHINAIFAKLGVPSRAAAITRVRS